MSSARPPWLDALLLDAEAFGLDVPRGQRDAPRSTDVAAAASLGRGQDALRPAPVERGQRSAEPSLMSAAPANAAAALSAMAVEIEACRACSLGACRNRAVPGQGAANARLFFVGEAPGEEEDRQGLAFVGAAGELLTRMISAMGFTREQVFIANVLKCRPPGNRAPQPEEALACRSFLLRQLAAVDPDVIVTLGAHATRNLLQREGTIGRLRGENHHFGRAALVATYHPAYLLRSPEMKRAAWEDLKRAKSLLEARARA